MTGDYAASDIVAILSALAAVISALAALVQAYRVQQRIASVETRLNGRLDELLAEREERLRVEVLLAAARAKQEHLPPPPATGRGDPVVRRMEPDPPQTEE